MNELSKRVKVTVHPNFKCMLKISAALENKSIIAYTKDLALKQDPFENMKSEFNEKTKKKKYDFF